VLSISRQLEIEFFYSYFMSTCVQIKNQYTTPGKKTIEEKSDDTQTVASLEVTSVGFFIKIPRSIRA
jgi:hypothetical protein